MENVKRSRDWAVRKLKRQAVGSERPRSAVSVYRKNAVAVLITLAGVENAAVGGRSEPGSEASPFCFV